MKALDRVLSGREARARLQGHILLSASFVVQVSLNLPGYPKQLPGSRRLVELVGDFMAGRIRSRRGRVLSSWVLENGMGTAFFLGACDISAGEIKEEALNLEETCRWGAILDVDVHLPQGALSRTSFGLPPRRCFLCGRPAKECARARRHETKELRDAFEGYLKQGLREMQFPCHQVSGIA
jgi:holo-ACP synthase CitX